MRKNLPKCNQEKTNEQISKNITCFVVLPVPYSIVPKYRYRVFTGEVGKYVYKNIHSQTERAGCEVVELNVQPEHVHLLVKVPSKISISSLVGKVKGKTAIQVFQKFSYLRTKNIGAAGYCVDTVSMDVEMIQKYVKFQDNK